MLLFGIDTPLAAVAGVFHIINHATFKASLFMAAGIIDHETGTRDMRRINGLWTYMPLTGTLAMVAAAAMAGVPLLNGFMSKEMFFAETLHLTALGQAGWLLPAAATLAGILAVAYSAPFLALASADVLGGPLPAYNLAIWHGFNAPFMMSLIALVGAMAAAGMPPLSGFIGKLLLLQSVPPDAAAWLWTVVLAGSLAGSLAGVVGLSRAGTQLFWQTEGEMPAGSRPRLTHLAPVVVLLAASVILTVFAAPVCRYAEATAAQLLTPRGYIEAVLHQENKP